MLTDVGGDEGIAASDLVEFLYYVLGHDDFLALLVLERFLAAPFNNLLPPGGERFRIRYAGRGFQKLLDFVEHIRQIANNGHIDLDSLGNRGRVYVNVNDLARNCRKIRRIANHAIIESGSDGYQDIAILHGHIGLIGAMHAQHTERLLVGRRIAPQTHQGIGHRIPQTAGKLCQPFGSIGENDPATGINHRPLGLQQHLHRLLDLSAVSLEHRVIGPHGDRLGIFELALLIRNVFRNINQDRTGAAGPGDVESLLKGYCQILDILDQEIVLDAGPGDAHRIAFLKGVLPDVGGGDLPADDHYRNGIHVRRGNPRNGICHARSRSNQADAYLVGRSRIGVRRMDGRLLMANQDMLEFVLFE